MANKDNKQELCISEKDVAPKLEQTEAAQTPGQVGAPTEANEACHPNAEQMVTISAKELENLRELAMQAAEFKDKWLRAAAEIENMRKRFAREREEIRKYAAETILRHLLPVFDNLEIALQATSQANHNNLETIKQGLQMICDQIKAALGAIGVKEINAEGQPFDHYYHEAISSQQSDQVPEGHVIKQIRKGYMLHDRLIRPASVIVAARLRPEEGSDAKSDTPAGL